MAAERYKFCEMDEIMDSLKGEMKTASMALKNVQMIASQLLLEFESKFDDQFKDQSSDHLAPVIDKRQAMWFRNIVGRLECQYDFFDETSRTLMEQILQEKPEGYKEIKNDT